MEKDLIKFNKKVEFINKDISRYEDEKGNMFIIPTGQLICNCSYMELDEKEYKIALFNKQIEDLPYEEIIVNRPSSKYERTKKEEDMFTIEDNEIEVKRVWVVANGLKVFKSFISRKEAIETVNSINDKILEML